MATKIEYTEDQKTAMGHNKGHLRIIACAGSGKTEVVSRRIARLIQKGAKPSEIVAFTFTEKAADEMKSRIRSILDEECPAKADFGDMYVGTIHSFCFHILQELKPQYKNYDVLDPAKRVAYLSKRKIFYELNLWPFQYYGKTSAKLRYYTIINRFIETVDLIMMEDINPEDLSKERVRDTYYHYCEILERDKYLDFSSMIYNLVKLLETDKKVLAELNMKIKHLIVDEYQDVNKIQEKLIEYISVGAESVCVVGDDDQCIYQWRGSFVDNIISFKDKYSADYEVTDVALDINFRSTDAVIYTAREFIKNNQHRLDFKNMQHSKKLERKYETGDIIYHHLKTEEDEHEFIYEKILSLLGTDFSDKRNQKFSISEGDIAVLVRRNIDAAHLVEYLDSRGIECIAYSGSSIFERFEVLLAMDCIAYLFNCKSFNYRDTPKISELKKSYKDSFTKDKFPEANVDSFSKEIKKLKSEVDKIFAKGEKDYLGDLGLQAIYHKILSCFGGQKFEFTESFNYNLAVLSTAISDYESVWIRLRASEVEGFFSFAKAYGESNYVESKYSDLARINAVKILTIHKAKGLEFPVVFVPGVIKTRKNSFLNNFINNDQDQHLYDYKRFVGDDEDERRLFYTAITRSEKYLFISGSTKRIGRKTKYKKHPFIDELNKKYISKNINLKRPKSGYPVRAIHSAIYPTSFSELTTYDRCPYDFQLRCVFGYNAGVPAAFGYGTNIHNILNVIHKDYIKSEKVPDEAQIDNIFDNMFHLRYATPKIAKNMQNAAKRVVKNYVEIQRQEFRRILETEKRFEFVLQNAIISGQIDLLKKMDKDGKLEEVEIIDFKTESASPVYTIDYSKQLRLYAIACLESLGLNPKKACIHHLDENKRSYVDISKKKLDETKNEISLTIDHILKKEFVPNPSDNCGFCDYKYLCSNKCENVLL